MRYGEQSWAQNPHPNEEAKVKITHGDGMLDEGKGTSYLGAPLLGHHGPGGTTALGAPPPWEHHTALGAPPWED